MSVASFESLVRRACSAAVLIAAAMGGTLAHPATASAQGTSFTGLYVGAGIGLARNPTEWTFNGASSFSTAAGEQITTTPTSLLAGGHIGYNFQSGATLLGLEFGYSRLRGEDTSATPPLAGSMLTSQLRDLFLATARLGVVQGDLLWYLKGGWASSRLELDLLTPGAAAFTSGQRHGGLALGAGLEWAFASRWSLGLEYLHVNYSDRTHAGLTTLGGPIAIDVDSRLDSLTARLNYKFN